MDAIPNVERRARGCDSGVRTREGGNVAGYRREETAMLADIVIPGIIVLVLIILLIVYLVRRA
jgi:hypothetical protein